MPHFKSKTGSIANWAQLAGERAQTIVKPYIPQKSQSRDPKFTANPMWSGRWGHATTVLNDTAAYRNDLSVEENSKRAIELTPKLLVFGGDDYAIGKLSHPS